MYFGILEKSFKSFPKEDLKVKFLATRPNYFADFETRKSLTLPCPLGAGRFTETPFDRKPFDSKVILPKEIFTKRSIHPNKMEKGHLTET
jgi:hypothetical protein